MCPRPADDRRVVGDRLDRLARLPDMAHVVALARDRLDPAAEADRIIAFGPLEFPGIAEREPVLRRLLLPAVANDLPEQAVVVADAVAVRGDRQGRHAVHETGGEPAEAAIAERGVRLEPAQHGEIDAELRQRRLHRLDDAEVGHRVEQHAADQEFEREVIDALPIFAIACASIHPAVDDDVPSTTPLRRPPNAYARRCPTTSQRSSCPLPIGPSRAFSESRTASFSENSAETTTLLSGSPSTSGHTIANRSGRLRCY